mmetsp:Transcript_73543/g.212835  ORF Transcript_73543/g.212835 Transcript_73543/m.212835 type:complete len:201 (-) Transcript_73543:216-818(-)
MSCARNERGVLTPVPCAKVDVSGSRIAEVASANAAHLDSITPPSGATALTASGATTLTEICDWRSLSAEVSAAAAGMTVGVVASAGCAAVLAMRIMGCAWVSEIPWATMSIAAITVAVWSGPSAMTGAASSPPTVTASAPVMQSDVPLMGPAPGTSSLASSPSHSLAITGAATVTSSTMASLMTSSVASTLSAWVVCTSV